MVQAFPGLIRMQIGRRLCRHLDNVAVRFESVHVGGITHACVQFKLLLYRCFKCQNAATLRKGNVLNTVGIQMPSLQSYPAG